MKECNVEALFANHAQKYSGSRLCRAGILLYFPAGRGIAVRMPSTWGDDPNSAVVVRPQKMGRTISLIGNTLILEVASRPLTLQVYDLKGRTVYRKNINRSTALDLASMFKSRVLCIVAVHDQSETIFSRAVTIIK